VLTYDKRSCHRKLGHFLVHLHHAIWGSAIRIATGLQAGGLVVLILVETRGVFSPTKHPYQLCSTPSLLFNGCLGSFPRRERP